MPDGGDVAGYVRIPSSATFNLQLPDLQCVLCLHGLTFCPIRPWPTPRMRSVRENGPGTESMGRFRFTILLSSSGPCILDLSPMRPAQFRMIGLAALTCLLSLAPAADAQNPTLITMDQAIDLAIAHNHSLKATRTLILQNQAQEITANLRPNPTLNFDSQFVPIFSPSNFSADNLDEVQQFDAGIGYLFERGKKRQHRLQAARDQTAVTRAQVTDAERNLTFDVAQQFVAVLLAESTLRFAELDLKSFRANGRHRPGSVQGGLHQRRRLPEDQAATVAVSDRCFLRPPGASAGPRRIAGVAGL